MRRQIAPWFGSKAALASQIAPEFGPHKSYVEPFAGGCGMILNKPPCRLETINDLHDDLTNLARVLADADQSAALQAAIDRRLCCETLNREARARLALPFRPTLDRAIDYFYVSWMGKSGTVGSDGCNSMAHRYGVASHGCASKLRGAAASIAAWHQRLSRVTITNRDAFKLLAKVHDEVGIVIYCDPPYVTKGGRYIFDFDDVGHARLAEALSRFQRTRVVLSYTDHPILDDLYPKWTKRILDYESRANRTAKVKKFKPSEILLINGPSLVSAPLLARNTQPGKPGNTLAI